jgi:hypothetical protein
MIRNCPDPFYNNCENALKLCHRCPAGSGPRGNKLLYKPTSKTPVTEEHPFSKDEAKSKRVKDARRVEQRIARELVKGTLRSGAALGDGDHHLLGGDLRQEVKDRGARSTWNLTWQEYSKGIQQGIGVYAISIVCPDGQRRTLYMLDEQNFTSLLAIAKEYKELKDASEQLRTNSESEMERCSSDRSQHTEDQASINRDLIP